MARREACRDTARCTRISRQHLRALPAAIAQHAAFLMHDPHSILASEHAVQRISERGFTYDEVVSVVECCEPVEWRDFGDSVKRVEGVCGDLATGIFKLQRYCIRIKGKAADGRPLIVVCRYGDQPPSGTSWAIHISTAYDPSDAAHQWAAGYTHRTCFCGGGDEEDWPRCIEDILLAGGRPRPLVYTSDPYL